VPVLLSQHIPIPPGVTPLAPALTPLSASAILLGEQDKRRDGMQAYCVKCRAKKEMKDAKAITMKNGKPATQGVCPTCGTKMFRIGSK